MYTRKNFIEAARILRESKAAAIMADAEDYEYRCLAKLEDALVTEFAKHNPRFDETRFRNACNPVEVDHASS